MRFLIGCSGAIGLVVFAIGYTVSLFVRDATWTGRLVMAALPAVIAFVAVLLLASRDSAKRIATMRAVRHALLAGDDTSEFDFVSLRPFDDATLLLETRVAIARFFDVPTTRINRDVQLVDDLRVDKLEPFFQFSVVKSVIASQRIEPEPFGFSMAGIETIDDLTAAIRHVINGFDRNIKDQGKPES